MGRVQTKYSLYAIGLLVIVFIISIDSSSIDDCAVDEDCQYSLEGSVCTEKQCVCPSGLLPSSDGTSCIPPAGAYGDACIDSVQCSARLKAGGVCVNAKCACKSGYHYLLGYCWKDVPLHGKCSTDEQCFAGFENIGISCEEEECKCRDNYYERGNACRRLVSAGQVCVFNSDCLCDEGISGTCDNKKCVCPEEEIIDPLRWVEESSYVWNMTPFADGCEPGLFNKSGLCVSEIGHSCTVDKDCYTGSTCLDGRACACSISIMVAAANAQTCVKVIALANSTCTSNQACTPFGNDVYCDTASTKQCVCMPGFHMDAANILCVPNKAIGEQCDSDVDCFTSSGNVECKSQVCSCIEGSHQAMDDCRMDGIQPGDSCIEDSDCRFSSALCDPVSKKCQCMKGFFFNGTLCSAGVGSPCTDSQQCSHLPHTNCSIGATEGSVCQCNDGFVSSDNSAECLNVAVSYGEPCKQTNQCNTAMGDLKECRDGKCGCEVGAQYLLEKCFYIRHLGEKCLRRGECVQNGENADAYMCQNGICACQYGFQQSNSICVPV